MVSGSCGKDPPYRTHSLGDGSKCRRGKGLKTIYLGLTRTSDLSLRVSERYLWALLVMHITISLASNVTNELVTG